MAALTFGALGITHLTARSGFQDVIDVPATLHMAADQVAGEIDVDRATFLLSRITILPTRAPGMAMWRKYFGLPDERTVVMSAHIEL